MRIKKTVLKKILGEEIFKRVKSIGEICEGMSYSCYLIGGTVRDMILKVPQIDIDIVTEGDITSLITNISKKLRLKRVLRSQFGTTKIIFEDNLSFDIAQTRKESYPYPASLPVVEKSTLGEDIKRRDFTINTLLMGITKKDFGKIFDYLDGMNDIETGIIRVLHNKSFIDDPTRIFRAFRFKGRLSFRFDRKTKKLIDNAIKIGIIKKLTPQRIRREIFLSLKEKRWHKIVLEFSRSGLLREIGIKNKIARRTINSFEKKLRDFIDIKGNMELTKLLIITENAKKKEIETFSQRVGLKKKETLFLLEMRNKKRWILTSLSKKEISPKEIYWLLKLIPSDGLIYLIIKGDTQTRKKIKLYLDNLKDMKAKIKGEDLKKLGFKEGPLYKKILKMVLDEKLNGGLTTKKEEIEFVRRFMLSL